MLLTRLVFILNKIVILFILCFIKDGKSVNQCAKYNEICDPYGAQPCCIENFSCKFEKSNYSYVCSETKNIEITCISNEDCSQMLHTKCSTEKKCICRESNIRINETYCAPLLGAFCWQNEICATMNTQCINNECQCTQNYVKVEDQCLPRILTLDCEDDSTCESVKYSKCSERKFCTCSLNTIAINSRLCLPILNVICETNADCKVENSMCVKNNCQCKPRFTTNSPHECQLRHLGMPCINDAFCDWIISHSVCSANKKCVCDRYYYQKNEETCEPVLNVTCVDNKNCLTENSMCINNRCQCAPNYMLQNTKCIPKLLLGRKCVRNEDCKEIEFTECSFNNKCTCKPNYKTAANQTKCVPTLKGFCFRNDDCKIFNSRCFRHQCLCKENYWNHWNYECRPQRIGQTCRHNEDCYTIKNSECLNHKCTCKLNYILTDSANCLALLRNDCVKKTDCAVENAICSDEKCQCERYFIPLTNSQCAPIVLTKKCETYKDCETTLSYCSKKKFCKCIRNHIAQNGTRCVPLLGERCSSSQSCATANSICVAKICQCKPNFSRNLYNQCVTKFLDQLCNNNEDCTGVNHTECLAGKCVCQKNFDVINNIMCAPLIGGYCSSDDDCYVRNSICTSNKCQCQTHFKAIFNQKCELAALGKLCNDDDECSMIPNAKCSNDICVCQINNFALNNLNCTPVLNGFCSSDEQCIYDYFRCLDNKCQCKSGFTLVSATQCVETHSLYFCETSLECSDSWHSNCSINKKCVCQPLNIAISNSTCLPILGGKCWQDNQCIVENSVCVDYHCACQPNFTPVADNFCVLMY